MDFSGGESLENGVALFFVHLAVNAFYDDARIIGAEFVDHIFDTAGVAFVGITAVIKDKALTIDSLDFSRTVYRGIQDVRAAVRYFRANADELGIDPNRIYLIGNSAGAILSLACVTPMKSAIRATGVLATATLLTAPGSMRRCSTRFCRASAT